jgi:hypothetical protein
MFHDIVIWLENKEFYNIRCWVHMQGFHPTYLYREQVPHFYRCLPPDNQNKLCCLTMSRFSDVSLVMKKKQEKEIPQN